MNIQEIASASALIKQELAPLADKIGEGAEYTFKLFVRQVYAEAIGNMLWTIVGIIFMIASIKLIKWANKGDFAEGVFLFSLALIVSIAMIFVPIYSLTLTLINPEYRAIELLINTIK